MNGLAPNGSVRFRFSHLKSPPCTKASPASTYSLARGLLEPVTRYFTGIPRNMGHGTTPRSLLPAGSLQRSAAHRPDRCQWRHLSHEFPLYFTVFQQAQRWLKAGTFEAMAHPLRATTVDTLDHLLALKAAAADEQDRARGRGLGPRDPSGYEIEHGTILRRSGRPQLRRPRADSGSRDTAGGASCCCRDAGPSSGTLTATIPSASGPNGDWPVRPAIQQGGHPDRSLRSWIERVPASASRR